MAGGERRTGAVERGSRVECRGRNEWRRARKVVVGFFKGGRCTDEGEWNGMGITSFRWWMD